MGRLLVDHPRPTRRVHRYRESEKYGGHERQHQLPNNRRGRFCLGSRLKRGTERVVGDTIMSMHVTVVIAR